MIKTVEDYNEFEIKLREELMELANRLPRLKKMKSIRIIAQQLELSYNTVETYLRGSIRDAKTALSIKNKIEELLNQQP